MESITGWGGGRKGWEEEVGANTPRAVGMSFRHIALHCQSSCSCFYGQLSFSDSRTDEYIYISDLKSEQVGKENEIN